MNVIDSFKERKVLVINATQDEYREIPNALELYYSHFPPRRASCMKCPSCGKMMVRKKDSNPLLFKDIPLIVGGHVKRVGTYSGNKIYILPICERCNNRKERLSPFLVNNNKLLSID